MSSLIQEKIRAGTLKAWNSFRARALYDHSGNANNLTAVGAVRLHTDKASFPLVGVAGNYFSYGVNTDFNFPAGQERTFHIWHRPEADTASTFYALLSQTDGSLTDDTGWYLSHRNNQYRFTYNNGVGANAVEFSAAAVVDKFVWTHLTVVIDRPNDEITFYVDGVDANTSALVKAGAWTKATEPTLVGSLDDTSFPYVGSFRDILVVDDLLTQTEIYRLIGELEK